MNKKPDITVNHFPLFAVETASPVSMREQYLQELNTLFPPEMAETLRNCLFIVTLTISKLNSAPLSFFYITRKVDNVTLDLSSSFDEGNFDLCDKKEMIQFLNLIPYMFEVNEWNILQFENKEYSMEEYQTILEKWIKESPHDEK